METSFPAIGGRHAGIGGENSFWPSFTDVMMVITLIFLMATSLLVVRNWQLVAELRASVAAEQIAAGLIESTSQENATLEERLTNAEQSNSILRLRLLKNEEELALAQSVLREQETSIAALELRSSDLQSELTGSQSQLAAANLEIDVANQQNRDLSAQIVNLNELLAQQAAATDAVRADLDQAQTQVTQLTESSQSLQLSITQLTQEKSLLNQEIQSYNRQLMALKGDYEAVRSKYEELIKPARSAKGKFIAEVHYVKEDSGDVIRYRQRGQPEYARVTLEEVESRLAALKEEQGKNLYVKIIIPENSGLTYNEAWNFMRNLLVKYDYYYQE